MPRRPISDRKLLRGDVNGWYRLAQVTLNFRFHMTEEQRKVTLRDGQDAGEMILDIERRIRELAEKETSTP
jgi:hypothetical protein